MASMTYRSAPQAAWSILFFRDEGEGKPIGIECQREQVRRSGPSELRRCGGHGEPQQEDGTRRPTTRTHTTIMRAAIVLFSGIYYEAVVQHITHVTDFVEFVKELYTLYHGERPHAIFNFQARVVTALQPAK